MREPRSIIFYAWAGLAVQAVLVAGVMAFVLAGAAYQRSIITDLHQRVQVLALANLTMQSDFVAAQRAVGGYQTTGQARFLRTYRAAQREFAAAQVRVRQLASADELPEATAQARSAQSAFAAYDRAVAARAGTCTARRSSGRR